MRAVCKPGNVDFSDGSLFLPTSTFNGPPLPLTEPFITGILLARLDLHYASHSQFLSTLLEVEMYIQLECPDLNEQRRLEYRTALCAISAWPKPGLHLQWMLSNSEPTFPQNKPPINAMGTGEIALCAAAWMGDLNFARQLLDAGVKPNTRDEYFKAPSELAAIKGHCTMVLLLLEHQACNNNVEYRGHLKGDIYETIYSASFHGHLDILEIILNSEFGVTATDMLDPAITGGQRHIIERLMALNNEYQPNKQWLFDAVQSSQEGIVRWCLESGVDPTFKKGVDLIDHEYDNILVWAALRGRVPIVRLLLQYGANRHVPALAAAALNGHLEIAKLLLDFRADEKENRAMVHGKPPFHVKLHPRSGKTPLLFATKNGHTPMVEFLIEKGVEKHFPVSEAVWRGDEATLRLLLEARRKHGAFREDSSNLAVAEKKRYHNVAKLLRKFGAGVL